MSGTPGQNELHIPTGNQLEQHKHYNHLAPLDGNNLRSRKDLKQVRQEENKQQ